jgi:hypothetical protein
MASRFAIARGLTICPVKAVKASCGPLGTQDGSLFPPSTRRSPRLSRHRRKGDCKTRAPAIRVRTRCQFAITLG